MLIAMIVAALLIVILLIPAIILTVLAKGKSVDESKSKKLWIGAWVFWGLIFLSFLTALLCFLLILA